MVIIPCGSERGKGGKALSVRQLHSESRAVWFDMSWHEMLEKKFTEGKNVDGWFYPPVPTPLDLISPWKVGWRGVVGKEEECLSFVSLLGTYLSFVFCCCLRRVKLYSI